MYIAQNGARIRHKLLSFHDDIKNIINANKDKTHKSRALSSFLGMCRLAVLGLSKSILWSIILLADMPIVLAPIIAKVTQIKSS